MSDGNEKLKAKAAEVHQRLLLAYGPPGWRPDPDPIAQLVCTILSQNTNDANRDMAYDRLRAQFSTWELVRDADLATVVEAIRPAGLANQKGAHIQQALRFITEQRGALNLNFLANLPLPEAKAWLSSMKGVGPKTAAIVLLFSLGRPAFPVDTHVYRVTRRLGLIGPRISRESAHGVLEELIEPDAYFPFHVNLISHGRRVCVSRNPRCAICVVNDLCDYYRTVVQPQGALPAPLERPDEVG